MANNDYEAPVIKYLNPNLESESDYFTIYNNFFIYTDSASILKKLQNFDTINLTKKYWSALVSLVKLFDDGDVKIITEVELKDDEIAYFIDSKFEIIDNFLPFDNARINSLIKLNMAPYSANAIGIFKIVNGEVSTTPHAFLLINAFKKKFGNRLYRVGLMSDIHYNDGDISDHTDVIHHADGDSEYISDVTKAFKWYEDKENVDFVCASGDVTSDNLAHLINFRTMIKQTMLTTPFYTCFGNHDYRSTYDYNSVDTIYDEYEDEEIHVTGKTHLQIWNSILTPKNPNFEIHYQDPTTEYGKTSYWFEAPTVNGKSDIYAFLSVNYLKEDGRKYGPINDEDLIWQKLDTENIVIDTTKSGYDENQEICESTSEYNVVLKYSNYPQRFGFDYHSIPNYTKNLRINKCKIVDANNVDITDIVSSNEEHYIGIYGTDETYHIDGTFEAKTFDELDGTWRIEMPVSGRFATNFPDVQFPVKIFLDIEIASMDIPETNQTTTANYKLTEDSPYMQDVIDYVGYMPNSYNLKFYDNAALLWLKDLLESHPDKRIFIFTHQFFPQKAGNNNGSGYSYTLDQWRIDENSAYCLCGIQFEFLNKLNNEFKNTIWFTGHSHYDFDSQITDNTVMICNKDFAIYRPGDIDFSPEKRYHRRNDVVTNYTKSDINVYEYFRGDTTTYFGEKMLYNRISLPNGKYSFKVFASNAYTESGKSEQHLSGDGSVELQLITTDGIVQDVRNLDYKVNTKLKDYSMYDFIFYFIDVEVTNGFVEINITKTNTGTNWFTAGILAVFDKNGNDITNTLDVNTWKKHNGQQVNVVYDWYNALPRDLVEETARKNSNDTIRKVYTDKHSNVVVTNNNTGYNVHIPSTSRPLASNYGNYHYLSTPGDYGSSIRVSDAAGMIMDIYEDYVDIRGISFKINDQYPNEYINKYHPIGQYRIMIPSA